MFTASRMVHTQIESVEVVPLCLQFRTLGHLPAHGDKHITHIVNQGRDRVQGTSRSQHHWQGHVNTLSDEGPSQLLGSQLLLPLREGLVDLTSRPTDTTPGFFALCLRQRTDSSIGQGKRGTLTRVIDAYLLQLGRAGGRRDSGQGRVHVFLDGSRIKSHCLLWTRIVIRACHGFPLPITAAESRRPSSDRNNRTA